MQKKLDFKIKPPKLVDAVLSNNAKTVLAKRYLKKNEKGEVVEAPEDLFWRVAYRIASVEGRYGKSFKEIREIAEGFYFLMSQGTFMPNSPTLMNAGQDLGMLSACFVLPVEDALSNGKDGIYDTLKNMALIHQSGGGTGFSFGRLRPRGSFVRSTQGVASGPVSFMRLYDASTNVVKQGGKRRGANMGVLRVDHPDIREFILCKRDTSKITNFNISVAVTDEFMQALELDRDYLLIDHRGKIAGSENARKIFELLVESAHATGEPGVLFIDEANKHNPVPHLGRYEACNPCAEQWLLPYDVCNLGSINLGKFVFDKYIDWSYLYKVVEQTVRFLDNVIDANKYPLQDIEDLAKGIRRIGLGVMGWADMLVKLGIPYGSEESLKLAGKVAGFIERSAQEASIKLAKEKGVFPEWENSVWGPDDLCAKDGLGKRLRPVRKLRNCNITTIAPTGTISIIAGCSGGIEPLFAVAFFRNQADEKMVDYNQDFRDALLSKYDVKTADNYLNIAAELGHIPPGVPSDIKNVFITAHDVTPEQHIRMQAAWQKYIDSSISKTCNFPQEATPEDVRKIYLQAYSLGCKGVTVYRDGSRPEQVLLTGKTFKEEKRKDSEYKGVDVLELMERPKVLEGKTLKLETPQGTLYTTLNLFDGAPFEVFANLGKAGSAANADTEAIGRLISMAFRFGIPAAEVVRTLIGIGSDRQVGLGPNKVLSVPDGIAKSISFLLDSKEAAEQKLHEGVEEGYIGTCPDCGSSLAYSEGCVKCYSCAYSECG